MKTFPAPLLRSALLLTLGCGMIGCSFVSQKERTQSRIAEKGDLFTRLNIKQQGDILGGAIERGNTTDMVYMALGQPKRIITSADGVKAMWVYVEEYVTQAPVITSVNSPNSSHYNTGMTAINTPAPAGAAPKWMRPMDFGTQNIEPVQSLDSTPIKTKTIYVFFFAGKVTEIKLDGDASDQKTAAPNMNLPAIRPSDWSGNHDTKRS